VSRWKRGHGRRWNFGDARCWRELGFDDKRVRKYAFDQEVTLSAVMVDAIEARLDAREG
jgi:hypothetical protein